LTLQVLQQQLQQQQLDGSEADAADDDGVAPDELPTFLQRSEIEVAEDALEEEADRRAFEQRRQRSQSKDELYDALHEDAGGQELDTQDGVYAVLSAGDEHATVAGTSSEFSIHMADAGRGGATAASTAVSAAPTPALLPLPALPDLESEHFSLAAQQHVASRLATPVRAGASTPLHSNSRARVGAHGHADDHEAQWIIDLDRDSNPQQYASGVGGSAARTVTIGTTRMRVALVGSAIRLWCFDDETDDNGEVVALAPLPKTPSDRDHLDDSIDSTSGALPGSSSALRRRNSSRRSESRNAEDDDAASLSSHGRSTTAAEAAAADQVVSSDRIKRMKEAYFFPFGSVVFFNFSLRSELQILHWLSCAGHLIQKWPAPINAWEVDSAEIGTVLDDEAVVQLVTSDMWERLTIAHTWARSVKVQVFEERVDACITQTKHLPRTMAAGLRPTLSSADLNRIIGYLLLEKRALNLDLDVGTLDTPGKHAYIWFIEICRDFESTYLRVIMLVLQSRFHLFRGAGARAAVLAARRFARAAQARQRAQSAPRHSARPHATHQGRDGV
jgi:uncharacterized Rmd1/YagE family protein